MNSSGFFAFNAKVANYGNVGIKGFYSSKKSYLQWDSTLGSLDQESNVFK